MVIPGAGFAREPGTHEHGLMKSMVCPVFLDFGPGPKSRPGMTAKFFRTLLRALSPLAAPRRELCDWHGDEPSIFAAIPGVKARAS